jgi:uncharacterized protein (TIGR00369 family)
MGARFYECINEAGEKVLLAIFRPLFEHQSYPERTHGGMTAAVLDEAIGRAVSIHDPSLWAVTIDLSVKYRKPVPIDQELYCETKVIKVASRSFDGEGRMFAKCGTTLATASGRYFILPPDKIHSDGISPENWFLVEDNIKKIVIGEKKKT